MRLESRSLPRRFVGRLQREQQVGAAPGDQGERMRLGQGAEGAFVGRPGPHHVEPGCAGGDEIEVGRQARDRAVDGADGELILGQLHDEGQDEIVRAGRTPVGGPAFGLIRQCRLVAVMPVGDDHRRLGHGGGDGVDGVAVIEHPELVAHAVVVVGVGTGLVLGGVERGRQPVAHRQPPDRREVGPGGPEQIETVALGLGQRLLVRQDVALLAGLGQAEGTDHPGRGPSGRVGHPVGVEARCRVGPQDPLGLPAGEEGGGHLVAVAAALEVGFGQLDQDGVGMVA